MNSTPLNVSENLRAAMRAAGLNYTGAIIADGKLHRFKASGDREKNSWYVLHAGTPDAGAFGCWKRSFKESWREKRGESFTDAEWQTIRERWKRADDKRQRTEAERHAKARKIAAWIFGRAKPVAEHAYIAAKAAKIFGQVREHHGALILPLRDTDGEFHS